MFSFAVLRLNLSPAGFWALSAAEWRVLLSIALPVGTAMDRAALMQLMQQINGDDDA